MHKNSSILLSLFLLLLLHTAAAAQSTNNGQGTAVAPQAATAATITSTLRGTVTDPSGALISGATVELSIDPSSAALQTQVTAADGRYSFTNVPPGAYVVRVKAAGFADFTSRATTANASPVQTLDVRLAIETQQVQLDVSADDAVDQTDPNRNGDAIVLKGKALDELANEPSMLQQQLQEMSGGDAPSIYVDGFSGGTLPPKNTIREIRINQNPYSARNDTDPGGGMIEIFTKPGTDKLHGDIYIYGNDSAFNTQNPFVKEQPSYHMLEFNGDINGPLSKKASYFTNFERRSSQTNAVIHATVLDTAGTSQIVVNQALPSPNTLTMFSPRVDLQMGKSNTLTLRYSLMKNDRTNSGVGQLNLASQALNSSTTTQTLQVGNSEVFGAKVVDDTRFQYTRTRMAQTPVSNDPTILVQGAFTGGGNSSGASHDNNDSYELQNYFSIQAGKHYLSPGIRLRIRRDANVSRAGYNGQYLFSSLDAYEATVLNKGGGPSQFSITTGSPAVMIDVVDLGAFYQDDWKVKSNLTLSYGLRYEAQNYISDHKDFAPRFGFSWGLGAKKDKPAKYVLRGGTGIFYTRLAASNIMQAERQNGISQQQYVVASPAFYPAIPPTSGLGQENIPSIYKINPSFRSVYGFMNSIGVDHPLGSHGSITVQYFYNRTVHALITRNANAPLPGTYNPAVPTSGIRPLGTTQNVYEYDSAGMARTNRLTMNVNFRTKNQFSVYGYYQFRHRDSDANGFVSNSYDVAADYGRGSQDQRHLFYASMSSPLLYRRIHLGTYLEATSGLPFNITLPQDLNGDSQFNDRPTFATDLTRPSVVKTAWGTFDTNPIAGQTTIPINYGRGPAYADVSAYCYREFTFGPVPPAPPDAPKPAANANTAASKGKPYVDRRYHLLVELEADNAINHVNLASPVGTLGSPLFGQSTALNGSGNANRVITAVVVARF